MTPEGAHIPSVTSGAYPLRAGNHVRPLVDGEPAFRRICEVVESAKKSAWVTVAFIDDGVQMPDARGSFFDVLDRAAGRGIDVRALFWRFGMAAPVCCRMRSPVTKTIGPGWRSVALSSRHVGTTTPGTAITKRAGSSMPARRVRSHSSVGSTSTTHRSYPWGTLTSSTCAGAPTTCTLSLPVRWRLTFITTSSSAGTKPARRA